uniref:Uncharacterized protein n=1 Tax=Arundo donax TaxID=35708 RepID=A0A0A8XYF1_ARUDO
MHKMKDDVLRPNRKQERKKCQTKVMLKIGGFHSVTSWIHTMEY